MAFSNASCGLHLACRPFLFDPFVMIFKITENTLGSVVNLTLINYLWAVWSFMAYHKKINWKSIFKDVNYEVLNLHDRHSMVCKHNIQQQCSLPCILIYNTSTAEIVPFTYPDIHLCNYCLVAMFLLGFTIATQPVITL